MYGAAVQSMHHVHSYATDSQPDSGSRSRQLSDLVSQRAVFLGDGLRLATHDHMPMRNSHSISSFSTRTSVRGGQMSARASVQGGELRGVVNVRLVSVRVFTVTSW